MIRLDTIDDLPSTFDLVVVGAGPAGLAAATVAGSRGLQVLLVDENPEPGGQIYRGFGTAPSSRCEILGKDYGRGNELLRDFHNSATSYMPGATVWMASRTLELGISRGGQSRIIEARHILLATGALERPFPISGWTLPGVMSVGAAQGLLKSSGLVPHGRFALAGTGPLLWLLAQQLITAEAPPTILLDTSLSPRRFSVARALPSFLCSPYFRKGWELTRKVRRHVPVISGVTELKAAGCGKIESVAYRQGNNQFKSIEVDTLFLHQGVVPNVNMTNAAGCEMAWDDVQLCWKPATDSWGRTSVEGLSVAGDGAGINGAEAAACLGRLCGLDAAFLLKTITEAERNHAASPVHKTLAPFARGRQFLDAMFQPAENFRLAAPDTIVCRCEEVTGRQISDAIADFNDIGPNQLKSYLRCGMGPCQGRQCGLTVTEMIAAQRRVSPANVGYYRLRFPIKPITVRELASLSHEEEDVRAVVRE